MKVTYYGHSCFAAQVADKTLLFDPFITGNELAKAIDVKKVPADYILISHGHADHLADAADIAKRTGATIISNYEVTVWFGKQGLQSSSNALQQCLFAQQQVCFVMSHTARIAARHDERRAILDHRAG